MGDSKFVTSDPINVGCTARAIISTTLTSIAMNLPHNPDGSYPDELANGLQDHSKMIAQALCEALGIDPEARGVLADATS